MKKKLPIFTLTLILVFSFFTNIYAGAGFPYEPTSIEIIETECS